MVMFRLLLVIFCLGVLGAQETVTVEGRVIDGVTMGGVPGAMIVLQRSDRDMPSPPVSLWATPVSKDAPNPKAARFAVKTDDSGGFRFQLQNPAEFYLFANKDGYTAPENNSQEWTTAKNERALQSIEFKVYPEARLSGRVLERATVKPVTGYAVYAERRMDIVGGNTFVPTASASPIATDGSFHIAKLTRGEYRLKVQPPFGAKPAAPSKDEDFADLRDEDYVRTWYPGVAEEDQAALFTVEAGSDRAGMDIRMEQRRIASIRGQLKGPESTARATIHLTEIKGTRTSTSFSIAGAGPWPIGQRFGFKHLSPGAYSLYASLPKTYAHPALRASRVFRASDHNIDNLDLTLTPGLQLTGSLQIEGVEGPLRGTLTVHFDLLQQTGIPSPEAGEVNPKTGGFSMEGLEPGKGYFTVRGLPRGFVLAETLYNESPAPFGIFALDERAGQHKVVLKVAAANGSVQATVRDGSKAVSGAMVMIVPDGVEEEALMRVMKRAKTGADGRASLTELLPGLYRALAFAPGAEWTADAYLAQRLRSAPEVRVVAGMTSISLRGEQ